MGKVEFDKLHEILSLIHEVRETCQSSEHLTLLPDEDNTDNDEQIG